MACGFYLSVTLLTFERVQRWFSIQADRLLVAAAIMAIASALWFVSILWLREKVICPYCMAAHSLGIAFAIPVLVRAWHLRQQETTGLFQAGFSVAIPAVAILMLGQIFGPRPETHVIVEEHIPPPLVRPPQVPGTIQFFAGAFTYKIADLPEIGSHGAKHQLVEYFDYTCGSCRTMSGDLDALFLAHPGQFAVTVLPCPLNRQCNRHCGPEVHDHPGACELAAYALAVWRKTPAEFAQYHHFLMHLAVPVDIPTAKAEATRLCGGPEQLEAAYEDPWIQQRLAATFEDYRNLSANNTVMPKLLLKDSHVIHGPTKDVETFLLEMQRAFRLRK
jgi:uncharacterized membrane protein